MNWSVGITERDFGALRAHVLRADGEEHAAFMYAGVAVSGSSSRLLVRRVVPVADEDFGLSDRGTGYAIAPRALARAARECDDDRLCLVWVHSHPLANRRVGLSPEDHATIDRGHPALLDLTHDRPVAALVMGQSSIAGEVWTGDRGRYDLDHLTVVGRVLSRLTAAPPPTAAAAEERFARQVLLIERDGQAILRRMTVGVIGAGGGGSLLVQSLAHLGVGGIITLDFDRVSPSNLSRIVGSEAADGATRPLKIDVLQRLVERVDPTIKFVGIDGDVTFAEDARCLATCDFIFLATDTMFSRYAFNLLIHQYLVPGIQVGAKVTADPTNGSIDLIHVAERIVLPDCGCLDCARGIDYDLLRWEHLNPDERRAQRYIDGDNDEIVDPSVITFNSISTSLASTDFLLMATGLLPAAAHLAPLVYYPFERELRARPSSPRRGCHFCDTTHEASVFGRGDLRPLSLRPGRRPPAESAVAATDLSRSARLRARVRSMLARMTLAAEPLGLWLLGIVTLLLGVELVRAGLDPVSRVYSDGRHVVAAVGAALILAGGLMLARLRRDLVTTILGGLAGAAFAAGLADYAATRPAATMSVFDPALLTGSLFLACLAFRRAFASRWSVWRALIG